MYVKQLGRREREGVCAAIFLLGTIAGTLLFNFHGEKYAAQFLVDASLIEAGYQQIRISYGKLAAYVLNKRGKRFLLLWLGEFTHFREVIRFGFSVYYGISVGILQSAFVYEKGMAGITEMVLLLFPQYICYWLNWKTLAGFSGKMQRGRWILQEIAIFAAGIFLEVYGNTWILKMYYGMK